MVDIKPEYANIAILDYKSLYPYTMIRNNISFDTLRLKILSLEKPYSEIFARQELRKLMLPKNPTLHELGHYHRYTGTGRAGSKLFGFLYGLDKELLLSKYADVLAKVEIIEPDYSIKQKVLSFKDIYDFVVSNKYNVTFNGAVFDSHKTGIVPMAEKKFLEKREYYKSELKKAKEQKSDPTIIARYDSSQLAYKIQANAGFGASGNIGYFGFDPYVFEAITLTAQYYAIMGTYVLNEYIVHGNTNPEINIQGFITGKSEYGRNGQLIANYTDTDSVILFLKDVIPDPEKRLQTILELADAFNRQLCPILVKQLIINEDFYKKEEAYNPKFKVEFIGSKAIFTTKKKRYVILDASYADKDPQYLMEHFNEAYKVAGFEIVKEVANIVIKRSIQKFFVYVTTDRLNIYNQLDVSSFLRELKGDIKQTLQDFEERIRNLGNNTETEIAEDIDDLLSDIADTVSWKKTKHVFYTLDDIVQVAGNDTKKLRQLLNDIPGHVLSMIVYNTITGRVVFTPGSKGYGFKAKHNKRLLSAVSKYLSKQHKKTLGYISVITQKLMSLNQFVSAYGDLDYILEYMDWQSLLPQLYSKVETRIKELIEDIIGEQENKNNTHKNKIVSLLFGKK